MTSPSVMLLARGPEELEAWSSSRERQPCGSGHATGRCCPSQWPVEQYDREDAATAEQYTNETGEEAYKTTRFVNGNDPNWPFPSLLRGGGMLGAGRGEMSSSRGRRELATP
jgi:hypothetical protein